MIIAILTGLLAGTVHVLAGPDHLAAIAPLALRRPRGAWIPGVRWGLGHSSGVAVVGLLSLLLRDSLPLAWLSSTGDRLVGVVLIGIGLWAMRRAFDQKVHAHEHRHGDERHVHVHVHGTPKPHEDATAHRHTHAAFAIGTLHGLAGSSHLLGILPMLALPTRSQAVAYLIAFTGSTVLAMAVFSWGVGLLALRSSSSERLYRGLMSACAVAAVAIGCVWLVGNGW